VLRVLLRLRGERERGERGREGDREKSERASEREREREREREIGTLTLKFLITD
jgi:hypothetical protein